MQATVLTAKKAAEILGLKDITIKRWASAGKIPGAKIGKKWWFIEADLLSWLRNNYDSPLKLAFTEQELCHLPNEETHIISVSALTEEEYKKALGLPIDKKRSASMMN